MIIYKTTNLINGKIYIGQDSKNNSMYLGSGLILFKAIKKYGLNNFKKEILEYCKTKNQLNEQEKYWIKKCNSTDHKIGYNIAKGGNGGDTITGLPIDEYLNYCKNMSIKLKKIYNSDLGIIRKNKISKSLISFYNSEQGIELKQQRKNFFESKDGLKWKLLLSQQKIDLYSSDKGLEIKTKISKSLKDFFESDDGIKAKQKLSNLRKGKRYEDIMDEKTASRLREEKRKMMLENNPMKNIDFNGEKNPFYGKTHSDEVKKNQSELMKGNQNFKGKKHSKETKKKLSDAAKKQNRSGKNNPMYGKSIFDVWHEKYSPEIAEEKIKQYKAKRIKKHLKQIK